MDQEQAQTAQLTSIKTRNERGSARKNNQRLVKYWYTGPGTARQCDRDWVTDRLVTETGSGTAGGPRHALVACGGGGAVGGGRRGCCDWGTRSEGGPLRVEDAPHFPPPLALFRV